jgi:hypothetical protein
MTFALQAHLRRCRQELRRWNDRNYGERVSSRSPAISLNEWPADKVERRAVASLVPYARNARTHSSSTSRTASLAGHGRVLAAKKLGLAHVALHGRPRMVGRPT